jgi:RNA polymerase sigma-70 factor, ECF subfamily
MIEDRRVLAGEAILNGHAATECSRDEAIETLVREHSRLVYRIAYAVLRQHHDAEDVTQETFMRVLRHSSKLPAIENPKTWLARIAWRVAVDRSKRRGRNREIALEDPETTMQEIASPQIPADRVAEGAQAGEVLEKLIVALPEKLRAPLILSAIEEMSPREIAAALNINEAAVRSRVFRARQILKEKLGATSRKVKS